MLAAPPPMTDRDEVLVLLRAWYDESPASRRDPRDTKIESVDALPMMRVALTSVVEGRGVKVLPQKPAPRPGLSLAQKKSIDAWAIDGLELPDDAPIGHRRERVLEGEMPCDCEVCAGRGKRTCGACGGRGRVGGGRHQHRCNACEGTGSTECLTCNGLGGFVGPPVAWATITESSATRVVRTPELPDEAALALDAVLERGGGSLVHRQEGARIERVEWETGYRGDTRGVPEALVVMLADLDGERAEPANETGGAAPRSRGEDGDSRGAAFGVLEASPTEERRRGPGRARVRAQRLEVRRACAYRVKLAGGQTFLVWGRPARVEPPDALDRPGMELVRAFGFGALAIGVAALLYLLTRG